MAEQTGPGARIPVKDLQRSDQKIAGQAIFTPARSPCPTCANSEDRLLTCAAQFPLAYARGSVTCADQQNPSVAVALDGYGLIVKFADFVSPKEVALMVATVDAVTAVVFTVTVTDELP